MLVPYTSLNSIAKILVFLMMPGGKAPDNTPLPPQMHIAVQYLMAQEPIVTEYGQGYLLQFHASATAYMISHEQMGQIMDGMSVAEKGDVFKDQMNISFTLAAYIVQKGYVPLELPEPSSYGNSSSAPIPASSLTTNQYYEDMRRKYAPTLFEGLQDTLQRNNVTVSFGVAPVSRRPPMARQIHGKKLTAPPGTIKQYAARGDIKMLQLIRDCRLAEHKKWFWNENRYEIKNELIEAERSLIDLGHIEYPQLQKMREIAKRGDMNALQARYARVCELVMDKRCASGISRKKEGTTRILWLEKRYLEHIKNNPLIEPLEYVAKGEGPELKLALIDLYKRYYCEFSQGNAWYERRAGFNIIETAHSHAMKHPNGAQIIAAAQQAFTRETGISLNTTQKSTSASHSPTPAPTTTAATDPGTTRPSNQSSSSSSSSVSTSNILLTPAHDSIISALNSCHDVGLLADQLGLISHGVFSYAQQIRYEIHPEIHEQVDISIDTIRVSQDAHTVLYNVCIVERVLSDIQSEMQPEMAQQKSLLERTPGLLAHGLYTFIMRCNPIAQTVSTVEFWVNTIHFGCDITLGKLYLSPEAYKARVAGFSKSLKALSPSALATLSAEQWMDVTATFLADFAYGRCDLSKTLNYLKEIETLGKNFKEAVGVAEKLRSAVDQAIAKNPIVIAKNGLLDRMNKITNELSGGAKEIIKDSRALLESSYAKMILELELEITALRPLFDGVRKGFGTFANKNIKINYKHILGMDIKFYPNKIDFSGFHHDLMGAIEKSGLVQFANKVMHNTGVYSADIIVNGVKYQGKTFFPASWSRQEVINAIYEVYDNFKSTGLGAELQKDGKWLIEGITKDGITIQMNITQSGLINTAYPIIR